MCRYRQDPYLVPQDTVVALAPVVHHPLQTHFLHDSINHVSQYYKTKRAVDDNIIQYRQRPYSAMTWLYDDNVSAIDKRNTSRDRMIDVYHNDCP